MMVLTLMACTMLVLCATSALAQDNNPSTLSGTIGYPSEEIPAMRIYAFASDGMSYYLTNTKRRQRRFTIANIPAGQYYVVAYPSEGVGTPEQTGGWSQFVTCGMTAQCNDHGLLLVTTSARKTVSNIYVADWYAPIEAFPPEPTTLPRKNALVNECTSIASQMERDACNLRGYQAANVKLGESYQRSISELWKITKCKERLIDDQNTCLTYRGEHCAAAEGIGYKGYISECLRAVTEQRLAYVQQQTPETCSP